MVIFEFSKDDIIYAEKIADLSNLSTIVVSPKSFNSELNDVVQVAIEVAPYVIPSITLVLIEIIKSSRKIKIKITENGFASEGISEEKSIELAREYITKNDEKKAQQVLNDLLSQVSRN